MKQRVSWLNRKESQSEERKAALIAMVGTEGLKDLTAISRLMHSNHYDYKQDPEYMVACHLLNKAIMEARDANCKQIGICKEKPQ